MTPNAPADLAAWHYALDRQCPRHHIDDWMPQRNQDDLIDQFEISLPAEIRINLKKIANYSRTCADAEFDGANVCEKDVEIHALRKLKLLRRFAAYACARFICSEPAICERPNAHQ
jgi:hypothetical protein